MTLGEYLGMVLVADAGVAALAGERVYSEILPQGTTDPSVVFDSIGGFEDQGLGVSGPASVTVQFDCYARTRAGATALLLAVKELFTQHSGGAGGFEVQGMFPASGPRWAFEEDTKLYVGSWDFDVVTSGVEA